MSKPQDVESLVKEEDKAEEVKKDEKEEEEEGLKADGGEEEKRQEEGKPEEVESEDKQGQVEEEEKKEEEGWVPWEREDEANDRDEKDMLSSSFPPPPPIPPPPQWEPATFWEKLWYPVVRGSALDPNDDGRPRRIWGYLGGGEDEVDLPLLPDGDPPADAVLPKFTKNDFADTTWTIGLAYRGVLPFLPQKVQRVRVLLQGDGTVVWDRGLLGLPGKGSWSLNEETNVFRFQKDTPFALNGRQWYPTLLAKEENRYYMEGYILGWGPVLPLTVLGLWQAYRDDVPEDERGPAPWDAYSESGPVLEG